ncbi:MAG: DNA mismatch repair protein MutS [Haloferacaceae archaeon]
MPPVTGPPAALAAADEELTPMLRQYVDLCERYDDALLLFRVGDFYKSFGETAEAVARTCELTLTEREDSTGTYPMAGIPVDNAATYLERLLDAGHRVAVADQVEDPEEASGLVDRAVTRVVTPGTVVDDELLAPDSTYVAAVARTADDGGTATHALAAVDVSTGECLATSAASRDRLLEELARLGPAEMLVGPDAADPTDALETEPMVTAADDRFDRERAAATLSRYVAAPTAVLETDAELRACGAVLAYAEYTQGDDGPLEYVTRIERYDPRASLRLDPAARRSLELFETRGAGDGPALFDVLDETVSALGRRRLASWLRRPLVDESRIEGRLDAVAALADAGVVRDRLRGRLREVYDLERLAGRVSRGRANARDLRSLATTLAVVPDLRDALEAVDCDRLGSVRDALDPLADVRELVESAVRPDPPVEITEGGVIREGFDEDLDRLRRIEREGREWVADLEERERERTGIDSLSVGHNQVHGYYIEVTDANLDRVPDDYVRRQTLKNSERFYTPALKEREDEIFGAAERADALEYELFAEVRESVAAETERLQSLADAVATLDALTALATVAVERDYARPAFHDDGVAIEAGRHPTVERTTEFVPNDADLAPGEVALVTGPNMSGKSTYMRQVALTCVLAQAGSFVPADAARLPVLDRVFTRVGASDDIAGGQSTFMREMSELSEILHGATGDSLVLLDEVGRGTATTDGRAIARAAVEFLHDEVGATTLFATHYHDLTALAGGHERVRNLHFRVARDGDDPSDVTFLHRVAEGPSSSSYGIEVARLAGVPGPVVERAYGLVGEPAETGGGDADSDPTADGRDGGEEAADARSAVDGDADGYAAADGDRAAMDGVIGATNGRADPGGDAAGATNGRADPGGPDDGAGAAARQVAQRLRAVDLATTTPLDALNLLHDLQRRVEEE